MIGFLKGKDGKLLMHYNPDGPVRFIWNAWDGGKTATIRKIYKFSRNDVVKYDIDDSDYEDYEDDIYFEFGNLEGEFYRIKKDVLSIENNLFIHKDVKISKELFSAYRDISIFRKIDRLINEDMYLGQTDACNLKLDIYYKLMRNFPNTTELNHYTDSRITAILDDYFYTMRNSYERYQSYLNKKIHLTKPTTFENVKNYEEEKYSIILDKLKGMLKNENKYTEMQWQTGILDIIILLYPKYIAVINELVFKDVYNDKNRKLDFALIDTDGNMDIIEIKKPDIGSIVSKRTYRDNFIPLKELSGSIMQVEKYIYYLQSVGKRELKKIEEKYKDKLPSDLSLKITNPQGIIILGRDTDLTPSQKNDFEIIKRKYKNIIDIISYEDLLNRLEMLLNKVYDND